MQHSQNLRETRVHDDRLGSNFLSHHEPMIRSGSRASISSTVTTRFWLQMRGVAVEMHENWLEATRYLNMNHLKEHKKEALRAMAA